MMFVIWVGLVCCEVVVFCWVLGLVWVYVNKSFIVNSVDISVELLIEMNGSGMFMIGKRFSDIDMLMRV